MSSVYVQHEYTINLNDPWSLNSSNTEMSSVLDGDEELLILDNSKLGFDDEYDSQLREGDQDFCRCANCSNNNRDQCLSTHHNHNGISVISSGDVLSEVNHRNLMLSESSHSVIFTHNGNNGDSDHHWPAHCHPAQTQTGRSRAVTKANRQLLIGCLLCLIFMLAEVIGGFISNSLAIMTDAAHLLSDLASFLLSLFAIWISQKQPTKKMSFGFHRAEVLGAVTSIFMIWVLTGVLVYLAVERIRTADYEIDSDVMLIVSGLGVAMNIVMGLTLSDLFSCSNRSQDPVIQAHSHSHGHSHEHSHGHTHHGHSHANMNVRY